MKVDGVAVNSEADFLNVIDTATVKGDLVELTVLRNIERSQQLQQQQSSGVGATASAEKSIQQQQSNMREINLKLKF